MKTELPSGHNRYSVTGRLLLGGRLAASAVAKRAVVRRKRIGPPIGWKGDDENRIAERPQPILRHRTSASGRTSGGGRAGRRRGPDRGSPAGAGGRAADAGL